MMRLRHPRKVLASASAEERPRTSTCPCSYVYVTVCNRRQPAAAADGYVGYICVTVGSCLLPTPQIWGLTHINLSPGWWLTERASPGRGGACSRGWRLGGCCGWRLGGGCVEVVAVCPTFIRVGGVGALGSAIGWLCVLVGLRWLDCWCCLFRCDVVWLGPCARVGSVLGPPRDF